jgi:hypothetical protein
VPVCHFRRRTYARSHGEYPHNGENLFVSAKNLHTRQVLNYAPTLCNPLPKQFLRQKSGRDVPRWGRPCGLGTANRLSLSL